MCLKKISTNAFKNANNNNKKNATMIFVLSDDVNDSGRFR